MPTAFHCSNKLSLQNYFRAHFTQRLPLGESNCSASVVLKTVMRACLIPINNIMAWNLFVCSNKKKGHHPAAPSIFINGGIQISFTLLKVKNKVI